MVERCNNVLIGAQGRSPEQIVEAFTTVWVHALYPGRGRRLPLPDGPALRHTRGRRARLGWRRAWRARRASITRSSRGCSRGEPRTRRPSRPEHRRRLLAGLSGRVIEVGAGNGLNFPHYPAGGDRGARGRARAVPAGEGRGGSREGAGARDAWSTASRTRCPPRTRRSTPASHRSCCARCPSQAQCARGAAQGDPARRRAALLRARARAGCAPRAQPGPHQPAVAALLRRLPSEPRHPGRDRGGRASRSSAAIASASSRSSC